VNEIAQPGEPATKDRLVEEQECRERLILCGCGYPAGVGEAGDERRYLRLCQAVGVPLAVKKNEAANPADIRLLGSDAVVPGTKRRPHAIE